MATTIDRAGRDRLSEALRHFLSGQITNFTFIERAPFQSADRAVREIDNAVWGLYDDMRQHRLTGRDAPSAQHKEAAARCVLFLQTDLQWEWPVKSFGETLVAFVTDLLTLGLLRSHRRRQYEAAGDFSVWPFVRRADYDAALQAPRLLAGSDRSRKA